MHFGALAPQGWKHDLDGLDPQAGFRTMIDVARRMEAARLDSVWLYDHFHAVPSPAQPGTLVFECWTSMMALALQTSTIRIGQMVTCAPYRNAGYLAKVAACVDVASGGRLEMGLGAGWYWEEFESYGYGFPPPRERLGYLRDTIGVLEAMWRDEHATYSGTYASVTNAVNDPKPLQSPRPPLWIGGGGEKVTLRITAEHADWANVSGSVEQFAHKRGVLASHCEAAGRDPAAVKVSWHGDCIVGRTDADVRRLLDAHPSLWGAPEEQRVDNHLVGTVQQVIDKIGAYREAGCEGIIVWFPDYPATECLDLFAAEVASAFR